MSILDSISDFSSAPIAIRKSIRGFARGLFRVVNNVVAVIIAQREYQANLAILGRLSDRELRDIGLERGQIGSDLAAAAKGSRTEPDPGRKTITMRIPAVFASLLRKAMTVREFRIAKYADGQEELQTPPAHPFVQNRPGNSIATRSR